MASWTKGQLDGFREVTHSLKLYRRAEFSNENDNESLIETLYVDPLPMEHVFQTMMKSNTTFLIGRKGTGKSTIFLRLQHELRKPQYSTKIISTYIDIKTVYESSQVDPSLLAKIEPYSTSLPKDYLEKYLLYKTFLKTVILAIQEEIKNKVKSSFITKVKRTLTRSLDELFEGLDNLLEDADSNNFIDITAIRDSQMQSKSESSSELEQSASINGKLTLKPSVTASGNIKKDSRMASSEENGYAEVLMRTFNIKEYILRLKQLLSAVSIKKIFILLDDFSELPEEAMHILVDSLLAPLNNWSEELIKFKVAAYPGRIYYGSIDISKIDEVNLDIYQLYGTTDVSAMEDKAIDFTKRLVEKRIAYYCKCDISVFTDIKSDDLWKQLFYASVANPRTLGYLLFYILENQIIYNKQINLTSIKDASQKYFEQKVESYFRANKFIHESFLERSSVFSLKELLESIVEKAKDLRNHRSSQIMRDIPGRPPTSHFHIVSGLDPLLSSLELNFFITSIMN